MRQKGGNVRYAILLTCLIQSFEEIPGGEHWFDGIMTHGLVGDFLQNVSRINPFISRVTKRFLIANPREMSQRGGIKVEQLISLEK